MSAFMRFSNDNRAQAKKELGGTPTFGDVSKHLGSMWQDVDGQSNNRRRSERASHDATTAD